VSRKIQDQSPGPDGDTVDVAGSRLQRVLGRRLGILPHPSDPHGQAVRAVTIVFDEHFERAGIVPT
jgi:hypothetical protein